MPFVPSSRSPKKRSNSFNTQVNNARQQQQLQQVHRTDAQPTISPSPSPMPSPSFMANNSTNDSSDSQSTIIANNNYNESMSIGAINNIGNHNHSAPVTSDTPSSRNENLSPPLSSSPGTYNGSLHHNNIISPMRNIKSRKFSMDMISDNEDDIPLSISFLRKPSRSNSVELSRNEKEIMQQNTLMNAKLKPSNGHNGNGHSSNNSISSTISNVSTDTNSIDSYIPSPQFTDTDEYDHLHHPHNESNENMSPQPTYFHPLVRKKSGELVKSSLKLNSIFSSSKSLPTTPTYKQVHFGVNIDVKYFDEKDKPTAISASNSPNASNEFDDDDDNDYDDYQEEDEDDEDDEDKLYEQSHPNDIYHVARDYVISKNVFAYNRFKHLMDKWNLDLNRLPLISYRDHIDRESPVFLERIFISVDKLMLIGLIAAKNLSFQKNVNVSYSLNNWKSSKSIEATYLPDIPRILKKSNYDRFTFKISCVDLFHQFFDSNSHDPQISFHSSTSIPLNMALCIQYLTNGQEFWDNNSNQNYNFGFTRMQKEDYAKSNGPPIKQSRHYLRRTKSHDDASSTSLASKSLSLDTQQTKDTKKDTQDKAVLASNNSKKTETSQKNESSQLGYSTPPCESDESVVKDNKLQMSSSQSYDNMFEPMSSSNSFIFNSKNFNFGSPGTPKLARHHYDNDYEYNAFALTSPTTNAFDFDFNNNNSNNNNFQVSTESQKLDLNNGLANLQAQAKKAQNLYEIEENNKVLYYENNGNFVISDVPKNLMNESLDPLEKGTSYMPLKAGDQNNANSPVDSYRSIAAPDTGYFAPQYHHKPPITGQYAQPQQERNSIFSSGSSSANPNGSSNSSRTSMKKMHKPDMNSKSYQNIIDQYCFFKSPSTVSTFLRSDLDQDHNNHGPGNHLGHGHNGLNGDGTTFE